MFQKREVLYRSQKQLHIWFLNFNIMSKPQNNKLKHDNNLFIKYDIEYENTELSPFNIAQLTVRTDSGNRVSLVGTSGKTN